MAAPTNAANVKKALANPEPSTHGTWSHNAVVSQSQYFPVATERGRCATFSLD